jgi:predicted phage tail protein
MKSKWVYIVVGVVLVLVGLMWVLQGLSVISGGFMSGSKVWFTIGLLVAIGGVTALYSGVRRTSAVKR